MLSPHDRRFLRNLRLACVSALALVGLLTLGTYGIQSQRIEGQAENSAIAAASGNQRMLSQRLTLLSLSLLSTNDAELRSRIRTSLRQAASAMEGAHLALTQHESGDRAELQEPIRSMYFEKPFELDLRVRTFVQQVRALADAPDANYRFDNPQLRYITSASTDLLNDLGSLTERYSEEGKQGIYGLERNSRVLLAVTMFVLALTAGLIFRPMLDRLRQEFERRTSSEDQLTAAAKQLSHYAGELESSNQELEQFANIVAHDLRAPLRTVMGFTECLKEKLAVSADAETNEFLTYVYTAAKRMDRLIYDLLLFSRVTSSEIEQETVNLDELMEEVLSDLALEVERKQAVVHCHALPTIEGNRTQLRQLFQNLLHNALKFGRTDHALQVRVYQTAAEEGWASIAVEDNGIGFVQEHAERIFQIFRRLHSDQEYEGSGVGLAICQKIVKKHQGTIVAEGDPSKGAKFTVTLPKRRQPAPPRSKMQYQTAQLPQ